MPRKPNYDRSDLIERARDLFWRHGWAGTSLKDLEAALQMKPGSFYAAFGSKDALYKLALERYATDGLERLDHLVRTLGPLKSLQHFPQLVIGNDNAPAKACMLSKTLLELQTQKHPLAHDANLHLLKMERRFADLFAPERSAAITIRPFSPAGISPIFWGCASRQNATASMQRLSRRKSRTAWRGYKGTGRVWTCPTARKPQTSCASATGSSPSLYGYRGVQRCPGALFPKNKDGYSTGRKKGAKASRHDFYGVDWYERPTPPNYTEWKR